MNSVIVLVGRILLSAIFILSGFGKLADISGTAAYFAMFHLPATTLVAVGAGLIELFGGLAILIGFQTRIAAWVLALFSIASALIAHMNWNLVRRTAPPGQAEAMQLVIKFSGLEEATAGEAWAIASAAPGRGEVSAPWDDAAAPGNEDPQVALGRKLLEAFEAEMAAAGLPSGEVSLPADYGQGAVAESRAAVGTSARQTAAERKREKLAQTHPDLLDAVQAGEMTLKQAYVEAGIEKPPQVLDKLQKLWRNATEEEQARFANWVQEQVQKAKKAAYEAEVYGEG